MMVQTCRGVGQVLLLLCSENVWEWRGQVWYISNYIRIYIFYCESGGEGCVSMV